MIDKNSAKSIVQKTGIVFMLAFYALCPAHAQERNPLEFVNSAYDEQHPVLSPAGDLYFTIAFHPENQNGVNDPGDIWMSSFQEDGVFELPYRVADLSTSGYDVFVGFLDPVSVLVYHDGSGRARGIHQYTRSGSSWEYEKQIELGSFRNQSDHFSGRLASSGDILVLSIESFGSYGNEDIYVSFLKEDGSWSTPQNLGPGINTYRQEMTPFLSADKRVLFFSSNGHGGQGGRDVFYATRLDESWENWSEPLPLSMGNTIGVELAYFELQDGSGNAIYTTTQDSEGYGDLVWLQAESLQLAEIEKPDTNPEPVVLDSFPNPDSPKTEQSTSSEAIEPKSAEMVAEKEEQILPEVELSEPLQDRPNEKSEAEANWSTVTIEALDVHTMEKIDFAVSLLDSSGGTIQKMDSKTYQNNFPIDIISVKKLALSAAGYLPQTLDVEKLDDQVLMVPVSKGTSMTLENVFFKRGTAELLDLNSMEFIRHLAEFLLENPGVKILLEGHTDNLGNPGLNRELSLDRASAIRDFLTDFGVEFERVRIAGWGGERPVANNRDEEGRQKNRRVEMRVLE